MKNNLKTYVNIAKKNYKSQKLSLAQFIDDFERTKNLKIISKKMTEKDKVTQLFIATAHQLCLKHKMKVPKWMQEFFILKDPYFVSKIKDFNLLALRDSPYAFRVRNIYVTKNFLDRY